MSVSAIQFPQSAGFSGYPKTQPKKNVDPQFEQDAKDIALQVPNRKASGWDYLAVSGNVLLALNHSILLFTLLINKKAPAVRRLLEKSVLKPFKLSSQNLEKLENILSDRMKLQEALKRSTLVWVAMQSINTYQTALNTKQPSLVLSAMLASLFGVVAFIKPTRFVYSLWGLCGILYSAGKRNDIENNNHPDRRHEFDFSTLKNTSDPKSFRQGVKQAARFILKDLHTGFSLESWRQLGRTFKDRESWKTPGPFMQSLSGQLFTACMVTNIFGMAAKIPGLNILASGLSTLGGVLSSIPIFLRGLQNKDELDGRLVLLGVPLCFVGGLFAAQFTEKYYFLNGLSGIGGPMQVRGIALNSKKYKSFVDELHLLHRQSQRHPQMTAGNLLQHFQSQPSHWRQLEKQIGKSRGKILLNLLRKADIAQKTQGVSLQRFLAPLVVSYQE